MDNFYTKNLLKTTFAFFVKKELVSPLLSEKSKSLAEFTCESAIKDQVVFAAAIYMNKHTSQDAKIL